MSNAVVIGFGSDGWSAEIDGTVGAASQTLSTASLISTAMGSGLQRVQLAWNLKSLSSKISNMLDHLYKSAERSEKAPAANGATSSLNREQCESAIRSLEYLYETTNRLCKTAKRKGLTNNSLMAGSLRSINRRAEEFLDLADWIRAALDNTPSDLDAIYAKARAELAAGEVFDLAEERAVTSHR